MTQWVNISDKRPDKTGYYRCRNSKMMEFTSCFIPYHDGDDSWSKESYTHFIVFEWDADPEMFSFIQRCYKIASESYSRNRHPRIVYRVPPPVFLQPRQPQQPLNPFGWFTRQIPQIPNDEWKSVDDDFNYKENQFGVDQFNEEKSGQWFEWHLLSDEFPPAGHLIEIDANGVVFRGEYVFDDNLKAMTFKNAKDEIFPVIIQEDIIKWRGLFAAPLGHGGIPSFSFL